MSNSGLINIKTKDEIQILRESGRILAHVVERLKRSLTSEISTQEINSIAEMLIRDQGVIPAFKGYRGFPGTVCASINNEVVHGIPSSRKLKDGDIISLDVGIIYQGYYSDMAVTVGIGSIDEELKKLLTVTQASLFKGIEQARDGNRLTDISHAVQRYVEANGFSVVRDFVGHGIGKKLHEEPEIPNFGKSGKGPVLKEGMVFAIEPMVNLGKFHTRVLDDGWTVVTQDGRASAHFEHSIVITKDEPLILTLI